MNSPNYTSPNMAEIKKSIENQLEKADIVRLPRLQCYALLEMMDARVENTNVDTGPVQQR